MEDTKASWLVLFVHQLEQRDHGFTLGSHLGLGVHVLFVFILKHEVAASALAGVAGFDVGNAGSF